MAKKIEMVNGHYPWCNHRDRLRRVCRVCDKIELSLMWDEILFPILHPITSVVTDQNNEDDYVTDTDFDGNVVFIDEYERITGREIHG